MIEKLFGGSAETINILGGIAFFVVCLITAYVLYVYMRAIKTAKSEGDLASEEWDGLKEYKNPLPVGWALIFAASLVWAVWYWLIGYPLSEYSQIGEWNKENQEYKAKFESTWSNPSADTLNDMGESIYLSKCSPCHGNTADGLGGRAADLLNYGNANHVANVIKNGSKGMGYILGDMPAGLISSESDIETVSNYVANGLSGAGADVYQANCASCHGGDGMGMNGSAPDLTKYGSIGYTMSVIKNGKKGMIGDMPAFKKEGTLTDVQYKAVSSYILSLGK